MSANKIQILSADDPTGLQLPADAIKSSVKNKKLWNYPVSSFEKSSRLRKFVKRQTACVRYMKRDQDLRKLWDTAPPNKLAVCVAAGPTADDQFWWMREDREKLYIIAASASLGICREHGVKPDLVFVLDPSKALIARQLNEWANCAPLVYTPGVYAKNLAIWDKAQRYYAYIEAGHDIYTRRERALPGAFLFSNGTVSHGVLDIAVHMGFRDIVLVGYDFSYPGGLSHAGGRKERVTFDTRRKIPSGYAPNWHPGRPVPVDQMGRATIPVVGTTVLLFFYLAELVERIYTHYLPLGVRILNTGRAGAQIPGTEWFIKGDRKDGKTL